MRARAAKALVCVLVLCVAATAKHRSESGTWSAMFEPGSDKFKLMMNFGAKGFNQSTSDVTTSELSNLNFKLGEASTNAHFELKREAGTFAFDGVVNANTGAGKFRFTADPTFAQKMKALGYNVQQEDMSEYALFDVSTAFVKEAQAMGYRPDLDELMQMRIFDIDRAKVADITKIKGSKPTIDELVQATIFDVDSQFAEEAKGFGFGKLSLDDLTTFKTHGVNAKFLKEMKEVGYSGFSADDAVAMCIHGVTPKFVRELKELGYSGVKIDDLIEMRIFGVTPAFIRRETAAGRHPSIDQLVERKRVSAEKGDDRDEDEDDMI
jgi:hypothetical protein